MWESTPAYCCPRPCWRGKEQGIGQLSALCMLYRDRLSCHIAPHILLPCLGSAILQVRVTHDLWICRAALGIPINVERGAVQSHSPFTDH